MASDKRIEPKILKGFRDYLPEVAIARVELVRKIQEVFTSFGFTPIDTPALEYAEILLGKGSAETDKQLFRFLDNGERDVALRFDLTVPLARFIALHANELVLPFKRYHIAPVWRAEKPQRGRFREFMQCDVDIVGVSSPLADAEVILVAHRVLEVLGLKHTIRINNRALLNGFLESIGAGEKSAAVLRAIDKLEKLGLAIVKEELAKEASLSADQIAKLLAFVALSKQSEKPQQLIEKLSLLAAGQQNAAQACSSLLALFNCLEGCGIVSPDVRLDLGIARGLDYYTGIVFETSLNELPDIGSICSGGRYDNLVSVYSKQQLSGVGGSFGLDRMLAALEELGKLAKRQSTAQVLVTVLDANTEAACASLAQQVRDVGIATELYPEVGKLGNQLKYASRKGIPFVIISGKTELERRLFSVKDLSSGAQTDNISGAELCKHLAATLKQAG